MYKYVDVTLDHNQDPTITKYVAFMMPVLGYDRGRLLGNDVMGLVVLVPNPDDPDKDMRILIGMSNVAGVYATQSVITIASGQWIKIP